MSGFDDQRTRFMRPDAHRYIRHDAYRFMKPGCPVYVGEDVVKYFWPDQRAQEPSKPNDRKLEQEMATERAALFQLKSELAALGAEIKFQR